MQDLPYDLNRTVLIRARRETVFHYFTDSARWAKWWGSGSTIEAKPGGKVYVRHPNGIESAGEVLEVKPPERIVFTYGFVGGNPIPVGSSRVTIRLDAADVGTRLHLHHEFGEAAPRDAHVQGWRFQLSLFANAVANEVYADAAMTIDGWYEAWGITDEQAREEAFRKIARPGVRFEDRYALLEGIEDLTAHSGASQRFMPGVTLKRNGEVRQCQGKALSNWVTSSADGKALMTGASVFVFGPDGKIESATGFAG
jgi:uncharacterized protein YndB with AHSA1/START domain